MKKTFNILLYLSIVFLAFFLYKNDFLVLPERLNWSFLVLAVLALTLGNILQSFCWKITLEDQKIYVSKSEAIASQGLSVFMKYIPGKIMTIIGRSAYVSKVSGAKMKESSVSSFRAQIYELIFGVGIGLSVFFFTDTNKKLVFLSITMFLGLIILIFFLKPFFRLVTYFALKFGKTLEFEPFSVNFSLKKIVFFSLHWLLWGLGFFFLAKSLLPFTPPFYLILAFPLATVLGVVAIFAPGGIGVRESTMVILLSLCGIQVEVATTIAVFSRVWFIVGELSIFSIATVLNRRIKS